MRETQRRRNAREEGGGACEEERGRRTRRREEKDKARNIKAAQQGQRLERSPLGKEVERCVDERGRGVRRRRTREGKETAQKSAWYQSQVEGGGRRRVGKQTERHQ